MTDATLLAAVRLFDEGRYLAAHELFEDLWESTHGEGSGFYKGMIQAAICMHHFEGGNLEGAARLYGGHRRHLAPYLPAYRGIDVAAFLESMAAALRPVVRARPGETPVFDAMERPRLRFCREDPQP